MSSGFDERTIVPGGDGRDDGGPSSAFDARTEAPGTELPSAADLPATAAELSSLAGQRVGAFVILGPIAEGGMGVVYRAQQDRPEREVALKLIRPGIASAALLRRFELEASVLGRLAHPGIAQVYAAGTAQTAAGTQPYFAMELVRGKPLDEFADARRLGLRETLALVAEIADAVAHAHAKGVVHRDLKPGNILVDAEGRPKVLDFGVARLTDRDTQAATMATEAGALVGTLPYMAPEQIAGDPEEIDTRTDVYALGVILYELLSGRLPHDLAGKTVYESMKQVAEREPPRLGTLRRDCRGDVETIVATAMAPERERRYQGAGALAEDLRRFCRDEPIAARPATRAYQLRKFAARNRALVGGTAAVIVVLAAGLAASLVLLGRAVRAEASAQANEARAVASQQLAESNAQLAEANAAEARANAALALAEAEWARQVGSFTRRMITGIDPETAQDQDTALLKKVVDDAAARLAADAPGDPTVEAELRDMIGSAYAGIGRFADADTHLSRAVALFDAAGATDETATRARLHLGQLRMEQGRVAEATALVGAVTAAVGESSPAELRVEAVEAVAGLAFMSSNLPEALEGVERALALARAELGETHERTMDLRGNRGMLLGFAGRPAEAEAELTDAIERSVGTRGEADPKTLLLRNNLATLLTQLGRAEEAKAQIDLALDAAGKVYGPWHPSALLARHNAALIPLEFGDPAGALALLQPLTADAERELGPEAPTTLRIRGALANALRMTGSAAEAEATARETLRRAEHRFGPDGGETARQRMTLGLLMSEAERLDEAEALYREALAGLEVTYGPSHSETLTLVSNLANVLRRQGRLDEAEPLARRALEGQTLAFGEASFQAMVAQNTLAMILWDAGRAADALPLARKVAGRIAAEFPEGHPNIAGAQLRLARIAHDAGADAEALPAARAAYAGLTASLGAEHPLTAQAAELLGVLGEPVERAEPVDTAG